MVASIIFLAIILYGAVKVGFGLGSIMMTLALFVLFSSLLGLLYCGISTLVYCEAEKQSVVV